MMQDSLIEYFVLVCRACRAGHIRADLPARPGVEGVTKCPSCGKGNPGWVVWGPFSQPFFANIGPGGGRQRVRVTVQDRPFTGYVVQVTTAPDGRKMAKVLWDDPQMQAQWGETLFPIDKLDRLVG